MRTTRTLSTLALAFIVSVAALTSACGPPPREKLVKIAGYGQQLAAQLEVNRTLPNTLFTQGAITAERRDFLDGKIATASRLVDAFNAGMSDALAREKPDVRALVLLTAEMIAEVQAIAAGATHPEWKKALAVIEVSLRAIAGYFASRTAAARAAGYTDEKIARGVGVGVGTVRRIEAYAAGG